MQPATIENMVFHVAAAGVVSNSHLIETVSSLTFANSVWLTPADADWLQFTELVKAWKIETLHSSDLSDVLSSPPYLKILAMGDRAIPLIIRQLILEGSTPYHWWGALRTLTNANPVPDDAKGNVRELSRYWVEWGRARYGTQLGSN